ncbi:MAG: hypothetical protein WDN76_05065 [Alphaproteobacteria bacterium]
MQAIDNGRGGFVRDALAHAPGADLDQQFKEMAERRQSALEFLLIGEALVEADERAEGLLVWHRHVETSVELFAGVVVVEENVVWLEAFGRLDYEVEPGILDRFVYALDWRRGDED